MSKYVPDYGGATFPVENNNGNSTLSNSQPENQVENTGLSDAFAAGLVYPQDVATMKRTEHYIQFFVNQQDNGVIRWTPDKSYKKERESTNVFIPTAPTTRTLGSITLFLPAQLNVAHKTNYGEAEIGLGVAGFLASKKGLGNMSFTMKGITEGVSDFLSKGKGEVQQVVVNAVEGAGATGAKAAFAIAKGETTNNRTEMKFEGIDRRSFSYSFRMIPRSSKEAETVKNIVDVFRMQSLPEVSPTGIAGRTLIAPSTFDIQYSLNVRDKIHHISTCVLESVNVKYGGERPQFFKDGYPAETQLDLQFKELEIITKDKVMAGF